MSTHLIKLEITPVASAFLCGEIMVVTDSEEGPAVIYSGNQANGMVYNTHTIRFQSPWVFLFVPTTPADWLMNEHGKNHGALWKDVGSNCYVAVVSTKSSDDDGETQVLEVVININEPFSGPTYFAPYRILGLVPPAAASADSKESKEALAHLVRPKEKPFGAPPPGTSGINVSDGSILGNTKDVEKT